MIPVETTSLTKRYGRTLAVDELSITVQPGEVYGFLGPNGAGKTSTLRMLLGLIRPTSGTLRLPDRPPGPGCLDRVGALIGGPAFYPYLSGRANVRVLANHAGVHRGGVDAMLELVDLAQRGRDRYTTYSLGMKQRLGLAAAMLKEPELLVLDEPTNGLDPAGMADMRTTVRKLAVDGCTVLFSSHLLTEVAQVCNRVGVLNGGRLVTETTVAELCGGGTLRVIAHPTAAAREHLAGLLGTDLVHVGGDVIDLDIAAADAARINTALVGADVAVSELHWREPDPERTFLELTGGDHRVD
ncbi:ABC transporter ATP-binding protein [Qaidamihabitans albus]|uniref:ABC transporter ATP-binding protein n=1 Tax=Qaidamihabitans albus TaxID=2795733 RepID=UPI0018F1E34D|nr:ATP-binding cassette domain-containing protein [Qaidamihabitans albus]